ncbi:MAG TPA: erythromycin esterase family protein, partial [Chitinophagaceae bacterium]|nr:erythromycin esterase family protein [Chitinophagaceae bacterium]
GPLRDSSEVITLLQQYNRWPTWMWGNHEVAALVGWMNRYNQQQPAEGKVGFYGLDVYCLWESVSEMMPYLPSTDAAAQQAARRVSQCFRPYSADAYEYARAVARAEKSCRNETSRLWNSVEKITGAESPKNEAHFVLQQNALVALNGESYYRTMVSDDAESWNIRDRHMAQTLRRLLDLHGPGSKAIVWEHNTHVGDARFTDMSRGGMTNVGELARKEYGAGNVFIVGFGSHSGTVIAASEWGGAIQKMTVPAAPAGSWEGMLHQAGNGRNLLLFSRELQAAGGWDQAIGHRAIGVVYDPKREQGNYVPSILPRRYDAFMFIDRSSALHPLNTAVNGEPPDTYPWGY